VAVVSELVVGPMAHRGPARRLGPVDDTVVMVPLSQLRLGPSPRLGGVKTNHVAALGELSGDWPPVLVRRDDNTIIDGAHRYLAARSLGHLHLACQYFDGDAGDAFVEAVRRNMSHGLPLTLRERKVAATRLLSIHVDWSDRRIAEVCGIAADTVGSLRASRRPSGGDRQLDKREGRDGRRRPVDIAAARARVAEEIRARPGASLREIAKIVGSSPETVRSVRREMFEDHEPAGHIRMERSDCAARAVDSDWYLKDAALKSTAASAEFAEWFAASNIGDDFGPFVEAVPVSRVYEVADEARRRARRWAEFAAAVEGRVRRSPSTIRP
jgi:hypothetical protein